MQVLAQENQCERMFKFMHMYMHYSKKLRFGSTT